MKIYTRTGDKGTTSLYDGSRLAKDDIRVESYGTIDELNSCLGLARNFVEDKASRELIYKIQRELFNVAGELATPDTRAFPETINHTHVSYLETVIDGYIARIEQVDKFIIPGSNPASASLHVARTVCRRAERRILTLSRDALVTESLMKYVNRLSDCLYAMARYLETELVYVYFDRKD